MSATMERELKLGVWPGFALPDLSDVVAGADVGPPQERRLEAVYYDTPDLRLLRRGVTVRFRRGEDAGGLWTAKLPGEAPALGLARTEVSVAADPAQMPRLLEDLTRGWALGASLAPVARLRTARRTVALRDPDGAPLAVIDDDEVSILRGQRVAARFRELEVELAETAPAPVLAALAERLRSAGAQPVDQVPKLVHALGPPALEPWDLAAPSIENGATAGDVARSLLLAAAAKVVDHHATVMGDDGAEGVRRARAGARRVRAYLKTFGPLLDHEAVDPVRADLGWLTDTLGRVRDLDVLIAGLREEIVARPNEAARRAAGSAPGDDVAAASLDGAPATAIIERLVADRDRVLERLRRTLRGARYAALLERVAGFAMAPPFASSKAERPAAEVLPALVRRPLKDLRAEAKALPDGELERLRKPVRRLRFAVEAAAPVAGAPAARAARELADLEDVLVQHHRAVSALERLGTLAEDADPQEAWAAGVLAGVQLERAAAYRARFGEVWRRAVRKGRWAWVQ
jgi:inorganic triphosphatase YgiF